MLDPRLSLKRFKSFFGSYALRNTFIHSKIPYFDQDKNGGKTKKEAELWSKNGCGMACLKMVLSYQGKGRSVKGEEKCTISELGRMCISYGGYTPNKETLDGLFYSPFLRFIKQEFGLDGKIISTMILQDILKELSDKNFVIASVTPEIRNQDKKPLKKGGHLILITGYDLERQVLYFHNPSDPKKDKNYRQISFSIFNKFFANRGIIIYI